MVWVYVEPQARGRELTLDELNEGKVTIKEPFDDQELGRVIDPVHQPVISPDADMRYALLPDERDRRNPGVKLGELSDEYIAGLGKLKDIRPDSYPEVGEDLFLKDRSYSEARIIRHDHRLTRKQREAKVKLLTVR